jgi:hypothetical protein
VSLVLVVLLYNKLGQFSGQIGKWPPTGYELGNLRPQNDVPGANEKFTIFGYIHTVPRSIKGSSKNFPAHRVAPISTTHLQEMREKYQ